jgi:peptidoglycan/xylan/chitin deacetylase (PgdA/CDA1 family)
MIDIVMYHYVKPQSNLGKTHLSSADFYRQLEYFANSKGILTAEQWESAKKGHETSGFLLTFDDGLKDHFDTVFPILKKLGLFGIFFVCSQPLELGKPLLVHLLHRAIETIDVKVLKTLITDVLGPVKDGFLESVKISTYQAQKDNEIIKDLKRMVNYYPNSSEVRNMLEKVLLEVLSLSQYQMTDEWYMNESQICEMRDHGMAIGSHGVSHTLLKNLDHSDSKFEVTHSREYFESIGIEIDEFCFPYGGRKSFCDSHVGIVQRAGYQFAHSVEYRSCLPSDISNRFELPRFDCNQY